MIQMDVVPPTVVFGQYSSLSESCTISRKNAAA
jgi:hypothetical protein